MQHYPSALTQWMKTLLGVGSERRYTVPSIRRHLTGGRMRWGRFTPPHEPESGAAESAAPEVGPNTVESNRRHRSTQNVVVLNQHHRGFLAEATLFNHLNYRSVWIL